MKRGDRIVHGEKELIEKLGRNDPCPCGSGKRFQALLPDLAPIHRPRPLHQVTRTRPQLDRMERRITDPEAGGSIPPGRSTNPAPP